MGDYVNREEMLKRFDRRAKSTVGDKRVGVDSIRVFIENIPAADVAPVVRCQNCKYYTDYGTNPWCEKLKMEIEPGFYCGFGEKYKWNDSMADMMILGTKTDEERDFYSGIQKKERE